MKQVLVVTGGSRGIGASTVRRAARAGYSICIGYCRQQETAESLADELNSTGTRAMAVRVDVNSEADVKELLIKLTRARGLLLPS